MSGYTLVGFALLIVAGVFFLFLKDKWEARVEQRVLERERIRCDQEKKARNQDPDYLACLQQEKECLEERLKREQADQEYIDYLRQENDRLEQRLEEEKTNVEKLKQEKMDAMQNYLHVFKLYQDLQKTNKILSSTLMNSDGSFSLTIQSPEGNESVSIKTPSAFYYDDPTLPPLTKAMSAFVAFRKLTEQARVDSVNGEVLPKVEALIRQEEKTRASIEKAGMTPMQTVMTIVENVTARLLCTGKYHMAHGELSIYGQDIFRLFVFTLDQMLQRGYITAEELDNQKKSMIREIKRLG